MMEVGGGVSVWLHLVLLHTFILHSERWGEPWPLSIRAQGMGMEWFPGTDN